MSELPAGPEKEARRKDWALRMSSHFRKQRTADRDFQKLAAHDESSAGAASE